MNQLKPSIFISYSHQDAAVMQRLATHLKGLQNQGILEAWHDQCIAPGDNWNDKIQAAMEAASAAVFLISADFLASDFIHNEEVPKLLKRRSEEGMLIIPVLISDAAWEPVNWLSSLQIIFAQDEKYNTHFKKVALQLEGYLRGKGNKPVLQALEQLHRIDPKRPVFLSILYESGQYTCSLRQGDASVMATTASILDPRSRPFGTDKDSLESLLQSYEIDPNKAPVMDIGLYLCKQTLGKFPDKIQQELYKHPELDLRVVAEDSGWCACLPWHLLSQAGSSHFISRGWQVSVSPNSIPYAEPILTVAPRILVLAPRYSEQNGTGGMMHVEELKELLQTNSVHFSEKEHFHLATTKEEFKNCLGQFHPDVLYFFGHIAEDGSGLLLKEGTFSNEVLSVQELSTWINAARNVPSLAYFNFCANQCKLANDSVMMLGQLFPSLFIGRSGNLLAAKSQAIVLLEQILLKAIPPHKAASALPGMYKVKDWTGAALKWSIPICFTNYSKWQATATKQHERSIYDPYWHLKLDRVRQFGEVQSLTRQMLKEQSPKSMAYAWFGKAGHGIEAFNQRLYIEFREDLEKAHVFQVKPVWPQHLQNSAAAFEDMILKAFAVNALTEIPSKIRAETKGAFGAQTLVLIRHEPVNSTHLKRKEEIRNLINPLSLKAYLNWWDSVFVPLLEQRQFALLGISFIVDKPANFHQAMLNNKVEDQLLRNTVFRLLPEMEDIVKKDLFHFIQTHKVPLPHERRDMIIEEILENTKGNYDLTVEELRKLLQIAFKQLMESEINEEQFTNHGEFDY